VPSADLYIEGSDLNDELDKLRLSATRTLFEHSRLPDRFVRELHLCLARRSLLRDDALFVEKGRRFHGRT